MYFLAKLNTSGNLFFHMSLIGLMYRVCDLRLDPDFELWLTADKNFYLWSTVEKMHVLQFSWKKHLRPYGCSGTNFTATVNCVSPKTEIQI